MSLLNADQQNYLSQLRSRIAAGEQPSLDEMREAVKFLRAGRMSALAASKTTRAKAPAVDANALLASLL